MTENDIPNTPPELNEGSLFEREFFGIVRHNLIAGTAEKLLTSPKAKARVRFLLDPLMQTMADVGGWADEIKQNPPDDPETKSFLADHRNANHREWHFVDLPLGATAYSRSELPSFTRDDDVVQIVQEAIRVLCGESDRFSELNAFRLLCHLVGDIHQPIHVGCGYLEPTADAANLVFDPDVIIKKHLKSDRGGNALLLPIGSNTSLHSYWDSKLGGSIDNLADAEADAPDLQTRAVDKLYDLIRNDAPAGENADDAAANDETAAADSASLAGLVEQWASTSLKTAVEAYRSLKIETKKGNNFRVSWEGKEKYDSRCVPLVTRQMKAAARNLAFLLDEIYK